VDRAATAQRVARTADTEEDAVVGFSRGRREQRDRHFPYASAARRPRTKPGRNGAWGTLAPAIRWQRRCCARGRHGSAHAPPNTGPSSRDGPSRTSPRILPCRRLVGAAPHARRARRPLPWTPCSPTEISLGDSARLHGHIGGNNNLAVACRSCPGSEFPRGRPRAADTG